MSYIDEHPGLLRIRETTRVPNVSASTPTGRLLRRKLEGLKIEGVLCVESRTIEKLPRTDCYADDREAQQHATVFRWWGASWMVTAQRSASEER